jgi:hypothetical protein
MQRVADKLGWNASQSSRIIFTYNELKLNPQCCAAKAAEKLTQTISIVLISLVNM